MPISHRPKQYGKHEYADPEGKSDCKFGCGCWTKPSGSGGPAGLDPFGTCPGNPVDGKLLGLLGGQLDYEYVVEDRIRKLESRARIAEGKLKSIGPSLVILAEELVKAKSEVLKMTNLINDLRRSLASK